MGAADIIPILGVLAALVLIVVLVRKDAKARRVADEPDPSFPWWEDPAWKD